jgi:hypothetical protein
LVVEGSIEYEYRDAEYEDEYEKKYELQGSNRM